MSIEDHYDMGELAEQHQKEDHITKVDEYRKWRESHCRVTVPVGKIVEELADAAIAKLEEENTVAAEDLEAARRDLQLEREWRGKAETTIERLKASWDGLRREVLAYERSGIDLYQRENGKAFRKMMDRWAERGKK